MHNWKKENYKVGEKVFIVRNSSFSSGNQSFLEGEVLKVGTKILEVKPDDNIKKLKFDERGVTSSSWGFMDYVYKSKEDYEEAKRIISETNELKNELLIKIKTLDLDKLKKIRDFIL